MEFHNRTNKVMLFAETEARLSGDTLLRGKHVLTAIVKEGTGVAAELLLRAGANLDEIRGFFGYAGHQRPHMPIMLLKSPTLQEAIKLARKGAAELGDREVCPIHLLIGLIETGDADTLRLLQHFKLNALEFLAQLIVAYQEKKQNKEIIAALKERVAHLEGFLKARNMTA